MAAKSKYCIFCLIFTFLIQNGNGQPCGGTFDRMTGTLESPNYPDDYGKYTDCKYYIDVDNDLSIISIVFNDFDLESVGINNYDTLQYGIGTSVSQNALGEFTGSELPSAFEIDTSSGLWLRFNSDINNYKEHRGFSLKYKITANKCGRTLTGIPDGSFTSPNYPYLYPSNMDCTYFLYVGGDFWTTITFKNSITFDNGDDFLYIGNGTSPMKYKALYTFTGTYNNPNPIEIFGNTLWFRTTSDDSYNVYGFSIVWHVTVIPATTASTSVTTTLTTTSPAITTTPLATTELVTTERKLLTTTLDKQTTQPITSNLLTTDNLPLSTMDTEIPASTDNVSLVPKTTSYSSVSSATDGNMDPPEKLETSNTAALSVAIAEAVIIFIMFLIILLGLYCFYNRRRGSIDLEKSTLAAEELQRNISLDRRSVPTPVITNQDIGKPPTVPDSDNRPNSQKQKKRGIVDRLSILSMLSVVYAKPNKSSLNDANDNAQVFINMDANDTEEIYNDLDEKQFQGHAGSIPTEEETSTNIYEGWEGNRFYGISDDAPGDGRNNGEVGQMGVKSDNFATKDNDKYGSVYDLPPDAYQHGNIGSLVDSEELATKESINKRKSLEENQSYGNVYDLPPDLSPDVRQGRQTRDTDKRMHLVDNTETDCKQNIVEENQSCGAIPRGAVYDLPPSEDQSPKTFERSNPKEILDTTADNNQGWQLNQIYSSVDDSSLEMDPSWKTVDGINADDITEANDVYKGWEENQFYTSVDDDFLQQCDGNESWDTNEENGFYSSPGDNGNCDHGWVDNDIYESSDEDQ